MIQNSYTKADFSQRSLIGHLGHFYKHFDIPNIPNYICIEPFSSMNTTHYFLCNESISFNLNHTHFQPWFILSSELVW